jgi:glucose-1-phosphate thymidylyltransferase
MKKAVILAGGLGTRMRRDNAQTTLNERQTQVADSGVKALIPLDRPFLDYVLTALADAGYCRICLVIGPQHDDLRHYYGQTLSYQRLSMDFAVQAEPLGTANAVFAAQDFAGEDPFLVINSDNYYPVSALAKLRCLNNPGLVLFDRNAMLNYSNIDPDRLSKFAVVQTHPNTTMKRIIEKPEAELLDRLPQPVGISMNCWRFSASIFTACGAIAPSKRGELELPDAVQYDIDVHDQTYQTVLSEEPVLDLSSREDIQSMTTRLAGTAVHL